MQLLDSRTNQQLTFVPDRVLNALQDIVNKVQIQPNFCISHPDYPSFELPAEAVERFEQIPLQLQEKYLSLQLQRFLYSIYYNSSWKSSVDSAPQQNLENNTFLGVDLEFYDRLHKSNSGEGYFNPDWLVILRENDGTLAVKKGDLTLHIEPEKHLKPTEQSTNVGDSVAILMPKNLVQNGFYMAVSNAGPDNHRDRDNHSETVRIYFNLNPEGAVSIMGSLTQKFNESQLPFSFKVLYNPSDYGRYDSGVLYFEKNNYEAIRQILQTIYVENQSHFQPEIPLFTKLLAPGLGLAEEPDRKFSNQDSFGTNRCQIVANGLLEARQNGDESPENRMVFIDQHFSLLGIDKQRAYLNANSEDIYIPLNL